MILENVDRNSKVVYTQGNYTFTVNDIGSPRHIRLLFRGKPVGALVTVPQNDGWVSVRLFAIKEEHRGKGFGLLFYLVLFALMPDDEKGITNNIKARGNQTQIPKLFARCGGYMDGDIVYIPKDGYNK